MHVSMSYGEELSRVHSPSAAWVHSVSTRGFEVCSRETNSVHFLKGLVDYQKQVCLISQWLKIIQFLNAVLLKT